MASRNPRRKLRQDGTVAWQARYRDPDGRQRAKEFTKKVDAERFLATTRADLARGDWINPADSKRLFADVAEHWRTTRVHADTTAAAVAAISGTTSSPPSATGRSTGSGTPTSR